jgi:predicted nucleotidyltransferase
VYEDVLVALADAGARFVVTGGVAIALHGLARPVADLDVVVEPSPRNLDAVIACLARLGFWPTLPVPIHLVIVMRTMDATGREVDVNRIYPLPFDALLARAAHVSVEGRDIAVVSREDLIAIKRQRGRDYDLDDLRLLGVTE